MDKKNKREEIIFWKAMVRITQVPNTQVINATWLMEDILTIFSSNPICLEISGNNIQDWLFSTKTDTKKEANLVANEILQDLMNRFPGLDGVVRVKPFRKSNIENLTHNGGKRVFYEIVFPPPPYKNRIELIHKFLNVFANKPPIKIYLKLIWYEFPGISKKIRQEIINTREKEIDNVILGKYRTGEEVKYLDNIMEMWRVDSYEMRIFIGYVCTTETIDDIIDGKLKSLFKGIHNWNGKNTYAHRIDPYDVERTLLSWSVISEKQGNIVTSKILDCNFPTNIPLKKGLILENEVIEYTQYIPNEDIILGRHISLGIPSFHNATAPKNVFYQHCLCCGSVGTGKSFLGFNIIDQFKDIGIININLFKKDQENLYNYDKIYKYLIDPIEIPYFPFISDPLILDQVLEEVARNLVAILGLRDVFEEIIYSVLQDYIKEYGFLPDNLIDLFESVIKFIEDHPYHEKTQQNFIRALNNRIKSLKGNNLLQRTLKLIKKVPEWFKEWREGKKVFLDLSICSRYVQRFLISAILQIIRSMTPDIETNQLKNLILIDEAHRILHKPITQNPDHHRFIRQEMMEIIFSELMKAFRSKGVGILIVDQQPRKLFDCVIDLTGLKILFRVSDKGAALFSKNNNEQIILTQQKNREALVLDGAQGYKYRIKTNDYFLPKKKDTIHLKSEVPLEIEIKEGAKLLEF